MSTEQSGKHPAHQATTRATSVRPTQTATAKLSASPAALASSSAQYLEDQRGLPLADESVSARIYQTPVVALPDDLYVPPHAFAIWLEQFAGPLDFLLYLVKKNNFDVTQMPILPITEQYLAYIGALDDHHFELAGDYLLMAATLVSIKSELLLPKPEIPADERDTKAELIERLEAYAQIKEVSKRLDGLVRLERDVFTALVSMPNPEAMHAQLPRYSPNLLVESLVKMRLQPSRPMHTINLDTVPLADRIASIRRQLSDRGVRTFYQLLDPTQGKVGVVVSFIAVLELIKRQQISLVVQDLEDHHSLDEAADSNQEDVSNLPLQLQLQ